MRGRRFDLSNLPLFWKLLVPFLALMVVFGAFGVFVIVRDLASRADAALEQELARRSVDAHALLRDRELFLLESANLASNLEGMAAAVANSDAQTAGRLLQSVMALKPDLVLVAVTDRSGVGMVEFMRGAPSAEVSFGKGTDWGTISLVRERLVDSEGRKQAGFLEHGGSTFLVIAAPVCATPSECSAAGVAIVGLSPQQLVDAATASGAEGRVVPSDSGETGVALFDVAGRRLGLAGRVPVASPRIVAGGSADRALAESDEVVTMHSPYEVQGRRVGTLSVTVASAPVISAVRHAAIRLAAVVLLAMVGVVIVGAVLSRSILRKVSTLLETNRAIGRGDLSARAPVDGEDELGELARGVNLMAEQLEASYQSLELRVAQRTEEIQRLLKERTEFFASLSHELRTPLAVILGEVKLMQNRARRSPEWMREAGRRLGYSAEQLLELVNEVLDLARAETGRIELRHDSVDVADLIGELQPTLDALARGADVRLEVSTASSLPEVVGDRARLREVILNLVDNAVKYTPAGGKVSLSAAAKKGVVHIAVADTGVGIPAEARPLLFEPFYRVPGVVPQNGRPSTGLGLALTKRLVEAHGGTIKVDSRVGKGSTFTVNLARTLAPAGAGSSK